MPIAALPQTTIRAIGSTSVISDPCSVVKELLDNALDASASSLLVEISQNMLDVIQLKDNGHGIPPEDHSNVCKHTFTSKIQTIDDLKNVGGSSLGFRGEALASVAEMSGGVTVTTRVASEVTGSCLKYARDGELSHSQLTSHPQGTTLRITDFLKYIPVRRQAALKAAGKNISAIKKLLQSYAFAQPSKRFSLKVLKAKNENNNWMYAPAEDATVSDAAIKIMGRDLSSCCVIKKLSSHSSGAEGHPGPGSFQLTAFLPKEDIDFCKVNNVGQFVSVDGRPLSVARGMGQEIAKMFKSYVRAAASRSEAAKTTSDPFLCLHIQCPQGVYDVNIEPAKDDVLFQDRDLILSLIEHLFREQYGSPPDAQKRSPIKTTANASNATKMNDSFDLLMARKRPDSLATQSMSDLSVDTTHPSPATEVTSQSLDMPANAPGGTISSDLNHTPRASQGRVSRHLNPWSISRINASFETPRREQTGQPAKSQISPNNSPIEQRSRGSPCTVRDRPLAESPELPSPPESRLNSSSPVARRHRTQIALEPPIGATLSSSSARKAARERDRERYGNGALDTWFQRTTQISLQEPTSESTPGQVDDVPTLSQLARERLGRHSNHAVQGPLAKAAVVEARSGISTGANSPTSPSAIGISESIANEAQSGSIDSGRGYLVLERWAASLQEGLRDDTRLNIQRAMDFERRKKEAMQQRRVPSNTNDVPFSMTKSSAVSHSPHHNRYLAAKAALSGMADPFYEPTPTAPLAPQDPRACLMRNPSEQCSNDTSREASKLRRLHTSRLPFERIPDGWHLHTTSLVLPVDLSVISDKPDMTCLHENTRKDDRDFTTFSAPEVESLAPMWNERLAILINQNYKTRDKSEPPGWQIDLVPIIAKHLSQFDAL